MSKNIKTKKNSLQKLISPFGNYWTNKNYYVLVLGIITIFIGYFFMSFEPWDGFLSLTLSPIILLISYVVIIPFAIFYRFSDKNKNE